MHLLVLQQFQRDANCKTVETCSCSSKVWSDRNQQPQSSSLVEVPLRSEQRQYVAATAALPGRISLLSSLVQRAVTTVLILADCLSYQSVASVIYPAISSFMSFNQSLKLDLEPAIACEITAVCNSFPAKNAGKKPKPNAGGKVTVAALAPQLLIEKHQAWHVPTTPTLRSVFESLTVEAQQKWNMKEA